MEKDLACNKNSPESKRNNRLCGMGIFLEPLLLSFSTQSISVCVRDEVPKIN